MNYVIVVLLNSAENLLMVSIFSIVLVHTSYSFGFIIIVDNISHI